MWGETYYINTPRGTCFLKIHNNYPWQSTLGASIELQLRLSRSLPFVAAPLLTTDGDTLAKLGKKRYASVYNLIDGEAYLARDAYEVMELFSQVYACGLSCENQYNYKLYGLDTLDMLTAGMNIRSEALAELLSDKLDVYSTLRGEYERLCASLKARRGVNRFITHGDVAKNLMKDKNGQICIIDWDRIRMAPAELDLYEFVGRDTDIRRLEGIANAHGLAFSFDAEAHNFFVLNKLFTDLRNMTAFDKGDITRDHLRGVRAYIDSLDVKLL